MALSSPQIDAIRTYLGYSSRFFQVDTVLEQAIAAIALDTDATNTVLSMLADLADIDNALQQSRKRQKFTQAEDLHYAGYREMLSLRAEGRRIVGRLAAKFGVNVRHDAYAASTSNDAPTWMSGLFGGSGGNNMKIG